MQRTAPGVESRHSTPAEGVCPRVVKACRAGRSSLWTDDDRQELFAEQLYCNFEGEMITAREAKGPVTKSSSIDHAIPRFDRRGRD